MANTENKAMSKKNNGEDILYHFIQKRLMQRDPKLAKTFIKHAINALSIWFHPTFYQAIPIILPFVVRDSSCRKNKQTGADEWASPNAKGLLRDDNSLVKSKVKSMPVESPDGIYKNCTIGNGFVASHIWRQTDDVGELASRDPWLNTFVPNLVWLPKQISKMTDREGEFAQQYVQLLARHIYREVVFAAPLQQRIEKIWDRLPAPTELQEDLPDVDTLNFFIPNTKILLNRRKDIKDVISALRKASLGEQIDSKVIASRYTHGLPSVSADNLILLANELQEYLNELPPLEH